MIFRDDNMPLYTKAHIAETLIIICKNIGLRKLFLESAIRTTLFEYALAILNDDTMLKQKKDLISISKSCI